jgi:hypothetical protein
MRLCKVPVSRLTGDMESLIRHLSGSALIGTYGAIKSTASIAKSRCSLRGQDGLIGIDHSF